MDQCKHCTVRGDFDKCSQTPCSHRETWGFREAVEQAHMAGQMDAGCKHPGYSNARAYFDQTHNKVFGNPPAGSKWVISKNLMNEYFVESQVLRAVEEEQAATPPQRTETIQQ